MDFIQQIQVWTRGELEQGKWMLAISLLLLPVLFLLLKSGNALSRGMVIPLSVLFLIIAGYGSYLVISRTKNTEQIENQFRQNAGQTIESQYQKATKDEKDFTLLKSIWGAMIVVSIVLYFFTKEYYRGLSLGLAVMFVGLLITDTFLHYRLNQYRNVLQEHISRVKPLG
ncbi:hypothetical protein QFZ37_001877 [Chryseobacterium ginsenosidimutans]|uniref:hypothetical protein n=1 Tax=Chryseobacterium ginsenosidimutans TaxID=687846 RepID=UPI00278A1C3D|nr:hypothetical protein [Chryseobacterium ginsenosidimutans]MDQ0593508.1 hypothetical protein [Chryseobacterium ginsenosidimutans]